MKTGSEAAGNSEAKILFLHHSTGGLVWKGGLQELVEAGNPSLTITEQAFPKSEPYGWKNYPYDYWNIWVRNAGKPSYQEEPTLEEITDSYNVVMFKHCFPVSHVLPDTGNPDVSSERKSLENYTLQYAALKKKLHEFPDTKFIVWTSAALVEEVTSEEEGKRSREFVDWVKGEWDTPGDNIFLWDFHALETEGGLFLKNEFKNNPKDSHPNEAFSEMAARCLTARIHSILEGTGDRGCLTGK